MINLNDKSAGSLFCLGELLCIRAFVDEKFNNIRRLSIKNSNSNFGDLYVEKYDKKFIINIKSRNKYQKSHLEKTFYNLKSGEKSLAKDAENEYGAEAYWMLVLFSQQTYSIFFGSISSLYDLDSIPIRECEIGSVGLCLVKDAELIFDVSKL